MKRRLIVLLAVLVGLMLMTSIALAADDPLSFKMQLSTAEFTGPQEVTVSIQIANSGDAELPGPVMLYYPDGTQVTEFGEPVLAAGASKSWSGTWMVTQDQLESGRIMFRVRYSISDGNGGTTTKVKNVGKTITYTGGVVSMEINRIITPTTAGNGQKVTVTYELINTGTVEITDVTITENKSISSKAGTISRVAVGAKESYSFEVKMAKKNLTSKATITYKAGGEEYKETKESATIKYGAVYLTASLTADKKGGTAGDEVKLTLSLKNSGKKAYKDLIVTDPVLGEVFSVAEVPAGKTVTCEKTIVLSNTMELLLTVKGKDESGDPVETSASLLKLTVINNDQLVDLSVNATVESEIVYQFPSIVKFRVYVTNNSSVDVSNVSVSASGKTLYTFPTILPGETRDFTRDVSIQMAGQYQFTASCKDELGQTQSFGSNIVRISYSSPTAVPTEVPIEVPAQPHYKEIPTTIENTSRDLQNLLGNIGIAAVAIACVGLLLILIAVVTRIVRSATRAKPMATLDEGSVRMWTKVSNEPQAPAEPIVVRREDTDPDPEPEDTGDKPEE